jgi:glycosyltransferase involved in cell wall biosynthesis
MKITIFATHPIQYQSPWFRAIEGDTGIRVRVLYAFEPDAMVQSVGFSQPFRWDIPLRDGFDSVVLGRIPITRSASGFLSAFATGTAAHLRADRPDAVLIMGWNHLSLVQAMLAARRRGIPVILRGDSNDRRRRPRWVTAIQRGYVARAAAILAVGNSNRDFYRRLGVAERRIFMAPHFIDNDRFVSAAAALINDRAAIRARWGVPTAAFCVLFVGKLEANKRVMDVLAAIDIARSQGVSVHGLIVGTGEQMALIQAFVRSHQLPVTVVGFLNQSEIARAYVAADALVLPSDSEAWGLVCNEAMACATPAIVSERVGCAGDLVIDEDTGAVAPYASPEAIAAVIQRWSTHPEIYRDVKQRAQDHVTKNYTIALTNRALQAAMDQIAKPVRAGPT